MATTTTIQGANIAGYLGTKTDPAPNSTYSLTGVAGGGPVVGSPILTSINPESATIGGANFTFYCNGAGFTAGSIIVWNGGDEPTTFVSAGQISTGVNMATMLNPATLTISVRNADGKVSETFYFEALPAAGG